MAPACRAVETAKSGDATTCRLSGRTRLELGDMPDSVSITLKGQSIGLSDLSEALAELATVLAEVDLQVTGRRSIEWKVVQLERSSATVGVAPVYRQNQVFDQRAQVIAACVEGLQALRGKTEPPGAFQRPGACLGETTGPTRERRGHRDRRDWRGRG